MKLEGLNFTTSIPDDSPEAIQIKKGYEWSFENSRVVIGINKVNPDFDFLEKKMKNKTASLQELNEIVLYLLQKSQT